MNLIKVFVIHHHPINFSLPTQKEPDFSLLNNSEDLLLFLHKNNFDFLIHGHRHYSIFSIHSSHAYPYLPVLCAGSFSAEIETQWAGAINNQFHVIDIKGRDKDHHIFGHVHNWTYIATHGWKKVDMNNGIPPVIPFGYYCLERELYNILFPLATECSTAKRHLSWSNVIKKYPHLEYLPITDAKNVFERLAGELEMKIALSPELIIWKD